MSFFKPLYSSRSPFTIGTRALYNTLLSEWFSFARALAYVARCLAFGLVVASSLLKLVDMHTIQMRPNAIQIIAVQRMNICTNVFHFVYSQEWITIYKDRKINSSCLCVCFATMRMLLNVSYAIVECSLELHDLPASICHDFPLVNIPKSL